MDDPDAQPFPRSPRPDGEPFWLFRNFGQGYAPYAALSRTNCVSLGLNFQVRSSAIVSLRRLASSS